ncbi:MAG: type II 3-dehydroquinate dehydratase [Ruminococcus sp.]|jgi:3-dehydroquinate dehydratase-2|nr:type II 3-dehydroquinate dehydratase [Ruminococcus sp.]
MNVLVINGPNLNLTGERNPAQYGSENYQTLVEYIKSEAAKIGYVECEVIQTNHEGEIIDKLHAARNEFSGVIINAGAYTHYSYAITDAIEAIKIPVIEVHLSNIHAREEFRRKSVIAPACKGSIAGFGKVSYKAALVALAGIIA